MQPVIEKILKKRDSNLTLLETISAVCEEDNIDPYTMADIIRNDQTMLSVLDFECRKLGLINRGKRKDCISLSDLF